MNLILIPLLTLALTYIKKPSNQPVEAPEANISSVCTCKTSNQPEGKIIYHANGYKMYIDSNGMVTTKSNKPKMFNPNRYSIL